MSFAKCSRVDTWGKKGADPSKMQIRCQMIYVLHEEMTTAYKNIKEIQDFQVSKNC